MNLLLYIRTCISAHVFMKVYSSIFDALPEIQSRENLYGGLRARKRIIITK